MFHEVMAIVFISPIEKQRVFFGRLAVLLIVFLIITFLIIFLPGFLNKTQNISTKISFNKYGTMADNSNITINFDIIDSNKVKNLKPFDILETEFAYIVQDKNGRQITGNISAVTKDYAQKLLEESDFKVLSLKEISIGRNEPFVSY